MKTFKSKSLSKNHTDFEIENGCHSISFLSFERAIKESLNTYSEKREPIGYRVTELGLEIIWS